MFGLYERLKSSGISQILEINLEEMQLNAAYSYKL